MRFEEIPTQILEVWKRYATARANYEMLDESKKSILAVCASKYEWTEATKERMARQDDDFRNYLKWVQEARILELSLKYELDSLDKQFEYFRSMNSLKKKEIDLI